jgi:hypothetical protein
MKIILWLLAPVILWDENLPIPVGSVPVSRCQAAIVPVDTTIVPPSWYHCGDDVTRDEYANVALRWICLQCVSLSCLVVGCCQLVLVSVYKAMSVPISL